MSQYSHYPSSSLPPYDYAPPPVATFEAGPLPVASSSSSSSAPISTAPPPPAGPTVYPYGPPYAAGPSSAGPPPPTLLPPLAIAPSSAPPIPDPGLSADPPVPGPLLPVKGDWTTQVALPLPSQVPPGGTFILPASTGVPRGLAGGTELVKVTGKSCANCRSRKVKCDRRYPECSRCLKRKEHCDFGDDVSIALRPTWVIPDDDTLPMSSQLRNPFIATSGVNVRPSHIATAPYPVRNPMSHTASSALRSLSYMQHQQALDRAHGHTPGPDGAAAAGGGGGTMVVRAGGVADDEAQDAADQSMTRLWESFLKASNLGHSSSDWRLALPTLATSLTLHLIDASMHSCCFHLPAFHVFSPEIDYFKSNVDHLDIASQVIVGILTSLGARASPHSAVLGIAGPDVENGEGSPEIVLSAGVRRESAWRAIVKRATDLCSSMEILQVPTARNAQTLVAFVQMLMLAEAKPKTARFFLRTAMGIFRDMQHSDLPAEEVQAIKASVGPTLFECDCRIAAYLGMPLLISDDDLYEYFNGTGIYVPDLAAEDLGPELDDILDPTYGRIDRVKLDRALGLTGYFVCAVQRAYAAIASSRRPSPRFRTAIPALWASIDRTHAAVQRLHRRLVQLDYVPEGCEHSHSVDYDLLISVRMDERLLDVVHLVHVWLGELRKTDLSPQDRAALDELRAVSERRVRKCLKLLAFYSKVFNDSRDKHVVYHLFTQLEVLPNWVELAAQREGEATEFGALTQECVLTETELEWFTSALELACFFTPLAADRLHELNAARKARQAGNAAPPPSVLAPYSAPLPSQTGPSTFTLPAQPSQRATLDTAPVSVAANLSSAFDSDQYAPEHSSYLGQAPAPGTWGANPYQPILSAPRPILTSHEPVFTTPPTYHLGPQPILATTQPDFSAPSSAEYTGSSDRSSISPRGLGHTVTDSTSSLNEQEALYGALQGAAQEVSAEPAPWSAGYGNSVPALTANGGLDPTLLTAVGASPATGPSAPTNEPWPRSSENAQPAVSSANASASWQAYDSTAWR